MLEIRGLTTEFHTAEGTVHAVRDVSFSVAKGEVVGIVGESGCGKSVTALSVMRLVQSPPGRIVAGEVVFNGRNVLALPEIEMCGIRGNDIAMIFQEPMTSLNPVFRIGEQIAESFRLHRGLGKKEAWREAVRMLELVGIPEPAERAHAYPHQVSGGMCQRVMIAMALACGPELLLADEPTTALDVTVQTQILELLLKLRDDLGMGIVMITHDLGVIAEAADRVLVMYGGRIVEEAACAELFDAYAHPYTEGLFQSRPSVNKGGRLATIPGNVPTLLDVPKGCVFAPRCPYRVDACMDGEPPLEDVSGNHKSACYRSKEVMRNE